MMDPVIVYWITIIATPFGRKPFPSGSVKYELMKLMMLNSYTTSIILITIKNIDYTAPNIDIGIKNAPSCFFL